MFVVPTETGLGQRLAAIMAVMAAAVANHAASLRASAARLVPMLALVSWRLGRIALRLDRLVLRWQSGTLPDPRAPRPTRAQPAAEAPPRLHVPTGNGWLVRRVQPTAQAISHIEILLADPQTQALVAAAPQAGRLLRPLCRMLAIPLPPWLRLPELPARPRPTPAAAPPPEPGTPDRPLPPYIRAAVRAWKRRGE